MFCLSTGQQDQSFLRQPLLRCGGVDVLLVPLIVLLLVAASTVALAELPQRNRTLTYQTLTHEQPTPTEQTQNSSRNRAMDYEPVTAQQPGVPQRHVAAYPDPQASSSTSRSSDSRSRAGLDELYKPLPDPAGRIDDKQIQAVLDDINRKSQAAKSGATVTSPDNPPGTPATDAPGNVPSTSRIIVVDEFFQLPGKDGWYAMKDGDDPFRVAKYGDKYYKLDEKGDIMNEVIEARDGSVISGPQTNEDTLTTLADDQTRNALMLIVTTIAVLAAIGIGILAFDYKHRWEQEIVSQNSRLLGSTTSFGGAAHGTFAELDSLEPETLRFSPHNYESLDDSFDRSFRTIA